MFIIFVKASSSMNFKSIHVCVNVQHTILLETQFRFQETSELEGKTFIYVIKKNYAVSFSFNYVASTVKYSNLRFFKIF